MSFVRVQFFGICTHIRPSAIAPQFADWDRRVVLVNASDPAQFRRNDPRVAELQPHLATLQVLRDDLADPDHAPNLPWFPQLTNNEVIEWQLSGVFLKIGNAEQSPADPIADCIPHLEEYVTKPGPELPPAGPRAWVADGQQTACFFDFLPAQFAGMAYGLAAVGVITVASESPTIEVMGFGGEQQLSIPLTPGRNPQITVCNIPKVVSDDKEQDFLFHFLVADHFPTNAVWPLEGTPAPCSNQLVTTNPPLRITQITTAGCSNSNYP